MEDWETFFVEKSKRRREKIERRAAEHNMRRLTIGALVLLVLTIAFYILR